MSRFVPPKPSIDDLARVLRDLQRDVDGIRSGRLTINSDIDMRGHRLTGLPTPVDDSDAQTKITGTGDLYAPIDSAYIVAGSVDPVLTDERLLAGSTSITLTDNGPGSTIAISATQAFFDALYQPLDAELTALAGLTSAADSLPYFTGSGTASLTTLTSFARTLLDDADAASARSTLGIVSIANGEYKFDTSTTASDPGVGKLRVNNADPTLVTAVYVDDVTNTGYDASSLFPLFIAGDQLVLQDADDASNTLRLILTAVPTDNTGWWTFPVSYQSHSGAVPNNNHIISAKFVYSGGIGGTGGIGDVVGPASAVSGSVALYNGTTGKLLKATGDATVDGDFTLSTASKRIKFIDGSGYDTSIGGEGGGLLSIRNGYGGASGSYLSYQNFKVWPSGNGGVELGLEGSNGWKNLVLGTGSYTAKFVAGSLASNITLTTPVASGTLALTSDISALSSVYQPLDSDLTSIAALTTTSYGRGFLPLADAAAARTYIGAGTGTVTSVSGSGGTTGLTLTGGPITTTGTLALGGTLAVANGGTGATDAATARTNLGVAIGSNVQAYDAFLTSIAALGTAADKMIYTTGIDTAAEATITSFGRSLVDDADAATARSTLGLVIGTNVQAYDAELAALAGLTSAADSLPYFTGSGTAALTTLTTYGRSLIDDADAATARTTLGLGALATAAYPGAGIPNSTGSAWGTSYTTTGSGTVVALQTAPEFIDPDIGEAIGTSFSVSSPSGVGNVGIVSDTLLTVQNGGPTLLRAIRGSVISTATSGTIYGGDFIGEAANTSGTISAVYGVSAYAGTGTGAVTNAYGAIVSTSVGGSTTNNIGLRIAPITGGTNNWSIQSAGGQSYHVGNLRIGSTTAPTVALDVTGAAKISTSLDVPKLANLTSNGIVKTSGSDGTLSVDTGTYVTSYPGSGIANSTGSAWGTSYSTTGSGTVVALQTSPTFLTSIVTPRVDMAANEKVTFDSGSGAYYIARVALNNNIRIARAEGGGFAGSVDVTQAAFTPTSGTAMALGGSSNGWSSLYIDESGAGTETAQIVAPTLSGNTVVTLPAVTGTLATLAGTETLTNKTLTSPVITGGSIDNTPIGATTASTLRGTTLTLTSTNNVASSLIPTAGLSYALGATGTRWTTVFANSFNATDYIDGNLLGLSSTIYSYNGINTAGLGVPAVYSESVSTTKTADFTAATYTPPSTAGRYRVSAVITTTSATNTGTLKVTVDYRDSQGTTHTADVLPAQLVSGTTGGYDADGTVTSAASKEFAFGPKTITINNAGVAIVIKVVTTGTVSYTVAPLIEQVG